MKVKNKKRIIPVFVLCLAMLTACGSGKNELSETARSTPAQMNGVTNGYSASEENYDYYEESGEYIHADDVEDTTIKAQNTNVNSDSIDKEMLVYSCTMGVDVLDFDAATNKLKAALTQYQGFVEVEQYNDGGSSSRWYDENEQKWSTYTATVRVPSRVYDDFCSAVSELGDLRSKKASAENVSQEYNDLSTTLEIYEKKEDRYLEMLSNVKDEANAVAIEEKLTSIQVEIAKLKTRMSDIKKDVAYSYVYVTLNEVKEYQAAPVKKDTFGARLLNTLKNTGTGFLNFLEELLFLCIYLLPYLVLFALGFFLLVKIIKALKKRRASKKSNKSAAKNTTVTENAASPVTTDDSENIKK